MCMPFIFRVGLPMDLQAIAVLIVLNRVVDKDV